MAKTIAQEINRVIEDDWKQWISFDEAKAKAKGQVIIVWKITGIPIPMNIILTQETLDDGKINFRELRGKIKNNLPHLIIKDRISEINSVLRDANRRHLRDVVKDFKEWMSVTGQLLSKSLGHEIAETFLKPVEIPKNLKEGTIQAIQFSIEEAIERLYNI